MAFKRKVRILLAAAIMAVAGSFISAAPAHAYLSSPHVRVYANACPGGYAADMYWNTQNESGTTAIIGDNRLFVDLWHVPTYFNGGSYLWINVKCNNGQWYAHGQQIYRPAGEGFTDLGWI